MRLTAGTTLIASPSLDDPNFSNAMILITEHNENGAMGFVLNKIFPRRLNDLTEFKDCPSFPLHHGGPVDPEHLYFIHARPDLINEGRLVAGSVYFGGNFQQVIAHLKTGVLTTKDLKIFVGYCGWDKDELEEEMKEGSWLHSDNLLENIFIDRKPL